MNIDRTFKKRYKIIKEIGQGGMGHVFLCEDLLLHTHWAGKFITKDGTMESMQAYHALKREVEILASLQHKSIPKIIDYIDTELEFIVIMEYMKGISMFEWLHKKTVNEKLILEWCIEILQILHYLHHESKPAIVFRDLKPGNLLVGDQCLNLIDFGIAIQMTKKQMNSEPCYGTRGFASKEQSQPGYIDCRCDIYSFGATLYYMYTKCIYNAQRLPNVKLKNVMEKCLQVDPDLRYQSVDEILNEIEILRHGFHKGVSSFKIVMIGIILSVISLLSFHQYKTNTNDLYNEYMLTNDYQHAINITKNKVDPYLYYYDQCKNQFENKEDSLMFAIQEMNDLSLTSLSEHDYDEVYIMMGFDCMNMDTPDFYRQAAILFENVQKEDVTIYIQVCQFLALHEQVSFERIAKLRTLLMELEMKADQQEFDSSSMQLYKIINRIYMNYANEFGIQIYEDMLRISDKAISLIDEHATVSNDRFVFLEYKLQSYYYQANYHETIGQTKSAYMHYEEFMKNYDSFVLQGYVITSEVSAKYNIVLERLEILREENEL